MPYCGTIRTFDLVGASGTILPDNGGEPIPFRLCDLVSGSPSPLPNQRYGYETFQVNGGMTRAVELRQLAAQPGVLEQQPRSQRN